MAAADTAKLIASLELKDAFSKPLAGASKALSKFDAKLSQTEGRAFKAGQQIGTGIKNGAKIAAIGIGLLTTQVLAGLGQLVKLESITTATNTVLASTKGVAGQTAAGIRSMSEAFENLNATMDDKVIQSGANLLLTFTNIRKDAFEPALEAALNLNEAMGGGEEGLQKTIIQVGKALNDPTKGLTALRKVGVSFTADQVKLIKSLQEEGDLLGAQQIILKELGTEFGGRFAAEGRTAAGTIAGIGDAVEDLQKGLATALFPTIKKLLPRFRELLISPQFTTAVANLGEKIADLFSDSNIAEGGRILESVFRIAKDAAPAIQSAAEVTGRVVKTAVDMFRSLPPELQTLAVAGLAINKLTGGLVTNLAGGLISAVISSFKGMMNVNAAVVNVNGGAAGLGGAAGGAGLLGTIGAVALPVTIAAIAATAATDLANANLRGMGIKGDLQTPGSGILPFGIESSIHNLTESIGILTGPGPKGIDRTSDAIERLRGAVDLSADRTEANTAAVAPLSDAVSNVGTVFAGAARSMAETVRHARESINADREARGLKGPFKRSTSLDPRFRFLEGKHSGAKDVAVAEALTVGFERKNSNPLFRQLPNLERSIKALKTDQRQLLKAGDTKNAALIGARIDRMKRELARRLSVADAAARAKQTKLNVTVPVSVKQFINGRLIEAATGRFTSTVVGSRGAFREFG